MITTFFGIDGCGKSTIARKLTTTVEGCTLIGGSSYKKWLTADVALRFLGSDHKMTETPTNERELVRLYEDVAIACYGLARRISQEGGLAIIDSDPYLKRLTWALNDSSSAEHFLGYVDRFEDRMTDALGANIGPDHIVNVDHRASVDSRLILARIATREVSSDHDPTNLSEFHRLATSVTEVGYEIERATHNQSSKLRGLNARLCAAKLIKVSNPHCSEENVDKQMNCIVEEIKDLIHI